jgi:hypothetical protein
VIAGPHAPLSVPADLVPDYAADHSTADGSDGAAVAKNGSSHAADSGADCGVLIACRHACTAAQAKLHGDNPGDDSAFFD